MLDIWPTDHPHEYMASGDLDVNVHHDSHFGDIVVAGVGLGIVAGFFWLLYKLACHPVGRRLLIVATVCIGLGIWQDGRRQDELPAGFPPQVEAGMLWMLSTGEAMPILQADGQTITVRTRAGYTDYWGTKYDPLVERFPLRQLKASVRTCGAHVGWP